MALIWDLELTFVRQEDGDTKAARGKYRAFNMTFVLQTVTR